MIFFIIIEKLFWKKIWKISEMFEFSKKFKNFPDFFFKIIFRYEKINICWCFFFLLKHTSGAGESI